MCWASAVRVVSFHELHRLKTSKRLLNDLPWCLAEMHIILLLMQINTDEGHSSPLCFFLSHSLSFSLSLNLCQCLVSLYHFLPFTGHFDTLLSHIWHSGKCAWVTFCGSLPHLLAIERICHHARMPTSRRTCCVRVCVDGGV